MSKKIVLLYANCIPVKGAKKSIICDLQRQNYVQIPNDLYNILDKHRGKSIQEIKDFYENKYDDIIENYFKLLLKNDFAFLTDTPELFPKLSTEWKEPFQVTNAIIDISEETTFELNSILDQLSEIHCKFLQIRFYKKISLSELIAILQYFNRIASNTIGIDILLPFTGDFTDVNVQKLFQKYKRLNSLVLHTSPLGKRIQQIEHSKYYIHTSAVIDSEMCCGVINKSLFSINIKTYTEALKFNSCLNGKISVDKYGEIKNCPSMAVSFGNINNTTLRNALLNQYFTKYWKVNKDQIEVCKDCEFRYICTDCRAYITNPEKDKSKPLKCGYDPYIGEWTDWNTSKLKQEVFTQYKSNK